ncbi:MAG TPA: PilW family protein [Burkholderiaceae bacterium]|nr:PilW family protein [Burkholderiaceae bacterium]
MSNRQRGLSLVELMISITIGLIVMSALAYVFAGSRGAYRVNENLARVQETGRFALDYIGQDLRMVSFAGCHSRGLTNDNTLVIARPAVTFAGVGDGLLGFENGTGWTNASGVTRVRGDVLTVRRASSAGVEISANTNVAAAQITVKNNCSKLRQSDLVLLASCERAVVLRITNTPATTCDGTVGAVVLEHKASGAGSDGSQGNGNNGFVTGSTSYQIADAFHVDTRASVYRFDEVAYFIGNNPAGHPGLYRSSSNSGTEELVENVEDMDILYGLDTSSPADGIADSYVNATAVTDWSQVVSVRISLLVAGQDSAVTTGTQTYVLRDTDGDGNLDAQNAPDSRLRQVFTSTIALRNRVL